MKVANTGSISPALYRRRKPAQNSAGGFSDAVQNNEPAAPAFAPTDIDSVSGLLSLQEIQDPAGNGEPAAKRGHDILKELDELRHGLLDGAYSEDKLTRLVTLSRRQADAVTDPRLREVIAEIELRAAVELAKLGKEVK